LWIDHAHDDYLEAVAERAGTQLPFLSALRSFSFGNFKICIPIKDLKAVGFGWCNNRMLCLLVHSLFDFNLHIPVRSMVCNTGRLALPENKIIQFQDTAHGLRLEPLINLKNQNLELVPDLMTDSVATAVERAAETRTAWVGVLDR